MAKSIHQELYIHANIFTWQTPYHKYIPETVIDTYTHRIYWNRTTQTDHRHRHSKPDYLIVIAVPAVHNIAENQTEKIRKYLPLASDIKILWNQERVSIIPIIIGDRWEISNNLLRYFKQLNLMP